VLKRVYSINPIVFFLDKHAANATGGNAKRQIAVLAFIGEILMPAKAIIIVVMNDQESG